MKDMRIKFQLPNQKEKDEFHKLATKFWAEEVKPHEL